MTAGQMVVAQALGLQIKSVIIAYSKLAGLTGPTDIRLVAQPSPLEAMLIGYGATLGLATAGAFTIAQAMDGLSEQAQALMSQAGAMLARYGAKPFLELVMTLESMHETGERVLWQEPS